MSPCTDHSAATRTLLDVGTIYIEHGVEAYPRGQEILRRWPDAERIAVDSHWRIPALRDADPADWLRRKRDTIVLGIKRGLQCRPNGRSADFIAPSSSNGCAMSCTYCYVARRKGHSNPITAFVNIADICSAIGRHAARRGPKPSPNQVDPRDWVYDLGENSDLSVDALISDNVRDLVALFQSLPHAKGSFATKWVSPVLLTYDPRRRMRVRMSLMPASDAKVLDVRTSAVPDRITFVNELFAAGYEVHLNFSPVVVREGFEMEWDALFAQVDSLLRPEVKTQLAAEVIMLTHNAALHEVNLGWHPRGEAMLWRPDLQEEKLSENGQVNLRYRARWKRVWLDRILARLAARMPYCRVRYAF